MRTFINVYGIKIHEIHCRIESSFFSTPKIYFVKNNDAEDHYNNVHSIALLEQISFIETASDYNAALELQVISSHLPISERQTVVGMDITLYDVIIPDIDKMIVYDGLSKKNVTLPKDFFKEDKRKTLLVSQTMPNPFYNLPDIILN